MFVNTVRDLHVTKIQPIKCINKNCGVKLKICRRSLFAIWLRGSFSTVIVCWLGFVYITNY